MSISENKSLMYEVIENMKFMVRVMDDNKTIIYMNRSMREEFGNRTGQKCYSILKQKESCKNCISIKCLESKAAESKDISVGAKYYRVIASPAKVDGNGSYSIEIFHDITDQKKLEKEFFEHYKKLKEDIEFAKQVQRKSLPVDGIYWKSLKINSSYLPSEDLGGDHFDIIKIDDNKCLFYIGDISGHGVRSSLLTMFLRQVVRGMKAGAADLTALIDELIKSYKDLNLDHEQYISVLCGLYNKETMGLSLINAGHNCPPLVIETANEYNMATEIEIRGMPICSLLTESNHEIKTLQMEKGDRILLYTDGLTEVHDPKIGQDLGVEGLKQIVYANGNRDGKQLVRRIIQEAKKYTGVNPIDDLAVVCIEVL